MILLVSFALALLAKQSVEATTSPQKPAGAFDTKGDPAQSLHSVGVRGTIDAGGYAASTTVKTQTEFFKQLVDLQVAVLRPAWAPQVPCAGAHSLRRGAISLLVGGNSVAAASTLEALLRTNDEPATRQLLGLAYEGTGQLEAAAEQFRTAAAAQSDAAGIFAYGSSLLLAGEVNQAEVVFHRSSGNDDNPLLRLGLGATLFQRGRVPEALGLFADAATTRPSETAAFGFITIGVRTADRTALMHLIDRLAPIVRRSPEDGSGHYALACALIAASQNTPGIPESAEIEDHLRKAVELNPRDTDAHFALAATYATQRRVSSAINEYRAGLEYAPETIEAHYRLSQLYERSGQPQLASVELQLYQQLRTKQKSDLESGRIPIRLSEVPAKSCQ